MPGGRFGFRSGSRSSTCIPGSRPASVVPSGRVGEWASGRVGEEEKRTSKFGQWKMERERERDRDREREGGCRELHTGVVWGVPRNGQDE